MRPSVLSVRNAYPIHMITLKQCTDMGSVGIVLSSGFLGVHRHDKERIFPKYKIPFTFCEVIIWR